MSESVALFMFLGALCGLVLGNAIACILILWWDERTRLR